MRIIGTPSLGSLSSTDRTLAYSGGSSSVAHQDRSVAVEAIAGMSYAGAADPVSLWAEDPTAGLYVCVLWSLGMDARASALELAARGNSGADPRGSWMDALALRGPYDAPTLPPGTKMWFFERAASGDFNASVARSHILDGLQWMLAAGLADTVDAACELGKTNSGKAKVSVRVTISKDRKSTTFTFPNILEAWNA